VDQLATDAKKLKEKGVKQPFVYTEVKRFLPAWATEEGANEGSESEDEPSELEQKLNAALGVGKKKPKGTMSLVQWVAAYDSYALAAAATDQWSYAASYAHKAPVFRFLSVFFK
jgi:hypothetical protein